MTKKKLTTEQWEEEFWDEVEEQSKYEIYEVLTSNIPLQNVPLITDDWGVGGVKKIDQVSKKIGFFPDKDTDYRVLLRDEVPNYYADNEEWQEKITSGNWDSEDTRSVAKEVAFWYLRAIMKGFIRSLSAYDCYENHYLWKFNWINIMPNIIKDQLKKKTNKTKQALKITPKKVTKKVKPKSSPVLLVPADLLKIPSTRTKQYYECLKHSAKGQKISQATCTCKKNAPKILAEVSVKNMKAVKKISQGYRQMGEGLKEFIKANL